MSHLRDLEFIDFAEGALPASRAAHLDTCAACRTQAGEIAATLRAAADVDMPEPSPLFWEHFSGRVGDAVAGETPGGGVSWTANAVRLLMPLIVVAAIVIAVVSAGVLLRLARTPAPDGKLASSHVPNSVAAADRTESVERVVDSKDAEVWAVLTAAASDMQLDEAHAAGMRAHPGEIDRAVQRLNQAELTELGRLLKSEMKRSSD